jgi:hypothetical protein
MGEVVTGKFELDIDKLAGELQASVHDLDQLRAVMVRIRADHGPDILCKVARHASKRLSREVATAVDALDTLQWVIGTEIGPDAMLGFDIRSGISRDSFYPGCPPPPSRHGLFLFDRS